MKSAIEDILGFGSFDQEKKIPGTLTSNTREYKYVSCAVDEDTKKIFRVLVRKVDPPLVTSGGVLDEGCKLILPSGQCYFAISYKGDIDGWRRQIELGASLLGLSLGKIVGENLILSNESSIPLSSCETLFY